VFQVNVPVLPTVSAKVTFCNFDWREDLSDELFVIPEGYTLDPDR
jgi:hypothetical protein